MTAAAFIGNVRDIYVRANYAALNWQLQRSENTLPWINTKINSITLRDYDTSDGLRGPDYTYGWIQGRGLEALIMHAMYFESIDNALSSRLATHARTLYIKLHELYSTHGYGCFCYDDQFQPVCTDSAYAYTPQERDPEIATYSDLFITKGLIIAAVRFESEHLHTHLHNLQRIITAIDDGRFLLSESGPVTEQALATQSDEYGPMMIAMGAAALLHHLSLASHDTFSARFTDTIFAHYFDQNTGLLANSPGGGDCNVGHAIELAGFAFDIARLSGSFEHIDKLVELVSASFQAGFNGTGLHLSVELPSLTPLSDVCPWWSLPETIRATALGYELTSCSELFSIWQSAHSAFFDYYWQDDPPIAYQSMTRAGPIDFVPATPDLDPGYHSGLSLLAAIEMAERNADSFLPT